MRIQLTSIDPTAIGGVQSWNRVMARAFQSLGHEVVPPGSHSDLGIMGSRVFPTGARRVIQVCHGIIEPERPDPSAHCHAYVSEEAQLHWGIDGPIVRQPIQTWRQGNVNDAGPVIRFSYYDGLEWLPDMVHSMGKSFLHVQDTPFEEARPILERACLVIASGRSALECAALGLPVLLLDSRFYCGPRLAGFMADAYEKERAVSFSGRSVKEQPEDILKRLTATWLAKGPPYPRALPPFTDHHPLRIARQLLDLFPLTQDTLH